VLLPWPLRSSRTTTHECPGIKTTQFTFKNALPIYLHRSCHSCLLISAVETAHSSIQKCIQRLRPKIASHATPSQRSPTPKVGWTQSSTKAGTGYMPLSPSVAAHPPWSRSEKHALTPLRLPFHWLCFAFVCRSSSFGGPDPQCPNERRGALAVLVTRCIRFRPPPLAFSCIPFPRHAHCTGNDWKKLASSSRQPAKEQNMSDEVSLILQIETSVRPS
jgi:hypothetical protein